jgi:hypothetical protein
MATSELITLFMMAKPKLRFRVSYDITATQREMIGHKLPLYLVLCLNYGY